MSQLIKKYWKECLLFVLAGLIMLFYQMYQGERDRATAGLLGAKIEAEQKAQALALADKYLKANIIADAEIKKHRDSIQEWQKTADKWYDSSIAKTKEIVKLKTCPEKLILSQSLLDECQGYVLTLTTGCDTKLQECEKVWSDKLKLSQNETEDWKKLNRDQTEDIVKMVVEINKLHMKLDRRLIVGPYAGWGINGPSVGIGLTYVIFRIKPPFGKAI